MRIIELSFLKSRLKDLACNTPFKFATLIFEGSFIISVGDPIWDKLFKKEFSGGLTIILEEGSFIYFPTDDNDITSKSIFLLTGMDLLLKFQEIESLTFYNSMDEIRCLKHLSWRADTILDTLTCDNVFN